MRRWIPIAAVAAVAVSSLAGAALGLRESDSGPVTVAVPSAVAQQAAGSAIDAECRALIADVPKVLDGNASRTAAPDSPYTAAWGHPAVKLRCGVAKPPVLDPTYHDFMRLSMEAQSPFIDGVTWAGVQGDGGYTFTTVSRDVYIEVWCPLKGENAIGTTGPLVDLAPFVIAHTLRANGAGSGPDPETQTY